MKKLNKLAKWIADSFWGKLISTVVITGIVEIIKAIKTIKISINMEYFIPYLTIVITATCILLLLYFIKWIRKKYQQKANQSEISNKADKSVTNELTKQVNSLKKKEDYNSKLILFIKSLLISNNLSVVKLQDLKTELDSNEISSIYTEILNFGRLKPDDNLNLTKLKPYEPNNPQ